MLPAPISHADKTLERASEDDDLVRAAAAALSGLASWSTGDLAAAHRGYTIATDRLERAGHVSDVLGCSITLADIEMTQGRLRQAERTFERALELAGRDSGPMRGVADMCVGLGVVARERDDLEAAAAHLRRSHELGDDAGLPQNPYRWSVAMARLREAEGDLDAAGDLLDEAVRVYVGDYSPNVRPVPAQRARVYVPDGRSARSA